MGLLTAPTVRAFLADGTHLDDAKAAQSFVGLNPSNWSSGQMESPSREITKEGPPVLRLAFYQAANVARTADDTEPSRGVFSAPSLPVTKKCLTTVRESLLTGMWVPRRSGRLGV